MDAPAPSNDAERDYFLPDFAPVPLLRKRYNGWTERNQRLFIAILAETGNVGLSARCVGLSARSAYDLRLKPGAGEFDAAWEQAIEIGRAATRDRLLDRWRNGRLVPVRSGGRVVGRRRVFNDRAMIAVLESIRHEIGEKDWRPSARRWMKRDHERGRRAEAAARKAEAEERARRAAEEAARLEADRPPEPPARVRIL